MLSQTSQKNSIREAREENPVVLFDGVCALCDWTVQFLLDKDKEQRLKFAPLQGETAATVLNRHPEIEAPDQSVILVRNYNTQDEVLLQRSDAILNILKEFGGFWRMLSWLRIIPRFIRDALYDWIARNRYRWFGKYSECRLPTPELKKRFLP